MDPALVDFFETAAREPDLASVTKALTMKLGEFGCDRFAYRAARLPSGLDKPFFTTTYDENWVSYYVEQKYGDVDPTVVAATCSNLPFSWRSAREIARQNDRQRRFIAEARDFSLDDGITIPIHGSGGEFATLSVVPDIPAKEFEPFFKHHQHVLHLIGLHYHNAVTRILTDLKKFEMVQLTTRQRECLLWTARGKTAWEVSEILTISEETVITHVKEAARKLGVHSKHHAVVKAIMLGLLQP